MPEKDEELKEEKTKKEAAVEETKVEPSSDAVSDEKEEEAIQEETESEVEETDAETKEETEEPQEVEQEEFDPDSPVTVKPVKFASFEDLSQAQGENNKNLDILMDIRLQMTVELGRTELPIRKVLELTRGSIIELEKVAGEPVELYANGKLVAHGEVVVIEDNFGLRITSITEPENRLKGIG